MIKLPLGLGDLDFTDWASGLVAAFISGGATAVYGAASLTVVDSDHFNIHTPKLWTVMGMMFMFSGVVSMANFLRTSPVPTKKVIVTTVETTEKPKQPPVVVTTVQETHVEAIAPKKEG